jgi:hypothetical protein
LDDKVQARGTIAQKGKFRKNNLTYNSLVLPHCSIALTPEIFFFSLARDSEVRIIFPVDPRTGMAAPKLFVTHSNLGEISNKALMPGASPSISVAVSLISG